uniref:Uncharacterized protein n=1 Tax=viral metagenome TaxID=1070528 RepID=A0A6M3LJ89_9ZZZZ
MRILNSKELAGLSQVFPEGFTGRVGLMILKAQHRQDLEDIIWELDRLPHDIGHLCLELDNLKESLNQLLELY